MSHSTELPTIPAEATGFTLRRMLTDTDAQHYEPVQATSGHISVCRVLATALRLGTIRTTLFDEGGESVPYGLVLLVDDDGDALADPVLAIPTHQAFLWWAANLDLTPEWPMTPDVDPRYTEDPRVCLLLTPETARELGAVLADHQLFSDCPASGDSELVLMQAIDTMRRLAGYAEHDRQHEPEPDEEPGSLLGELMRRRDQRAT